MSGLYGAIGKMSTRTSLTLPAQYIALEQIPPFIESVAQPAPCRQRTEISLAVHELCVNIVQHGYAGIAGELILDATCYQHGLFLSIFDTAPNAYKNAERNVPNPLNLPESGWGLVILHRVMDDVCYARSSAGNAWHLIKLWDR